MDETSDEMLRDLRRVDKRALVFTPFGLGGPISAANAARFQSASIARAQLVDAVPEVVRANFERARLLHLYGILQYEFFSLAPGQALLVLEGALRLRFIEHYGYTIPILRKGVEEVLAASTFDIVLKEGRGAHLRGPGPSTHPLPSGLSALLRWARRHEFLRGTRSRRLDAALADLRNFAAHPVDCQLGAPPASARMLDDVAEIINKLWGHDTPGGRLFPGPVAREVIVAAISPDRNQATQMRLDQVAGIGENRCDWTCDVFLAAPSDDLIGLAPGELDITFRSAFQMTTYPCERLWGGTWQELESAIELRAITPRADSIDHLDRLFFIRVGEDGIDFPRSHDDLVALDIAPEGRWLVAIADFPLDAWAHVRDHEPDGRGTFETCPECFVRVEGRFASSAEALAHARAG